MATTRRNTSSFFKDLTSLLTGQLVLPEDAAYEQVRQLWSGKVNKHPAAFVRCANAQNVIHAVRWVRAHGLALSVRGGGHDYVGRALCEDGVVIDCSQMRAVSIDPVARTARVQGGATIGDLIEASQEHGLATTTGTVFSVGMAGLTLGGGYGPLMGAYGLAADNLLSAQVVTADGQCVSASASEHADLFWGLRSGGGNFGVVVSLEYRLHPVAQVLSGLLLYPLDQAREVLPYYNEFITSAPDELTIMAGFLKMPDGMLVLFLSPTYCGSLEEGERLLSPLRTFVAPLVDQIQPVAYNALIHAMDAIVPQGRHYFIQTQWLDGLRAETIEVLIEHARQFSSPFSAVALHHFHGAAITFHFRLMNKTTDKGEMREVNMKCKVTLSSVPFGLHLCYHHLALRLTRPDFLHKEESVVLTDRQKCSGDPLLLVLPDRRELCVFLASPCKEASAFQVLARRRSRTQETWRRTAERVRDGFQTPNARGTDSDAERWQDGQERGRHVITHHMLMDSLLALHAYHRSQCSTESNGLRGAGLKSVPSV